MPAWIFGDCREGQIPPLLAAGSLISQEIVSCERKSLRQNAQLAEKKPARARNKSCAIEEIGARKCAKHTFVEYRYRSMYEKRTGFRRNCRKSGVSE